MMGLTLSLCFYLVAFFHTPHNYWFCFDMLDVMDNALITVLHILSCQPKVTVTSCCEYKVIRDLESIYHFCINPIHRIGLIHK